MSKITDIVRQIAESEIEKLNIELIDVEFVKEGSRKILRLYIDKRGGVGLDDCEQVSRLIEPLLDEKDPINEPYVFEVSSPGLDRPLKTQRDFERYAGELVEVKLYAPINNKKTYEGNIVGYEDNMLKISMEDGSIIDFNMKDVSKVKKVIKFNWLIRRELSKWVRNCCLH